MNSFIGPELHDSVAFREEGKIIALPHEKTGTETAAALPDDNAARADDLASEGLHAESLRI